MAQSYLALTPLDEAAMNAHMQSDHDRFQEYKRAWDAYYGRFDKPLKVDPTDLFDDNVVVNRIKPIVACTVSFLFGTLPTFELPTEIDGEETSEESELEAWMGEVFEANNLAMFLNDLATNGAVCGTAYARVWPAREEYGEEYPRFHVLDPECMTIFWDARDISTVTGYEWRFNTTDPETKRPRTDRQVIKRNPDGGWTIIDQYTTGSYVAAYGVLVGSDGWVTVKTEEWPYLWPPIIHCKNLPAPNCIYGEPDISTTIISGNRALNFNLSNRNKIDRMHGHPVRYVKGMQGQRLDISPGKIIDIPDPDGEIGQLAPEIDSQAPAELAKEIYESMLEEAATPSIVLGRTDATTTAPSGAALRVKLWPLVNKTEQKHILYGPLLIELIRRLFELGDKGDDIKVRIVWPDVVPLDKLQEAQMWLVRQQMGIVSHATLAAVSDLNWDIERENLEKEGEDAMERKVEEMERMAGSVDPSLVVGPDGKAAPRPMPPLQQAQAKPKSGSQPQGRAPKGTR